MKIFELVFLLVKKRLKVIFIYKWWSKVFDVCCNGIDWGL